MPGTFGVSGFRFWGWLLTVGFGVYDGAEFGLKLWFHPIAIPIFRYRIKMSNNYANRLAV